MRLTDAAKEEVNQANNSPYNPENAALMHAMLAQTCAILALVERISSISEPVYLNKDGTMQYAIKHTGGNNGS